MNQVSSQSVYSPALFNPLAPEVIANPYAFYEQYRVHEPVHKTPLGFWLVTRHDDVALVLRDRRFGRDFEQETKILNGPHAMEEPLHLAMSKMLLFLEPPHHPRIRKLMTKAFSAHRAEQMRAQIKMIAESLIERAIRRGQFDVVSDFALPLPMTVMFDMLGIPLEDRTKFFENFRVSSRVLDIIPLTAEEKRQANDQLAYLKEYFHKLFEVRRCQPGNDLISDLVRVEEERRQSLGRRTHSQRHSVVHCRT
jgi:cytochrome P450